MLPGAGEVGRAWQCTSRVSQMLDRKPGSEAGLGVQGAAELPVAGELPHQRDQASDENENGPVRNNRTA